ncbi:MAG: hypothetical protein KF767_06985 [Bdellovibrionaceae bacterium]|nr:hypothetical protein [Pseudobdellovibrionaceae bacterium]
MSKITNGFSWNFSSITSVLAAFAITLSFQNCQNNGLFENDLGFNEINRNLSSDNTCADPLDSSRNLNEGEWRLAFRTPTVAPDEYCHAQKRVCSSGKVFGNFRFESCSNEVLSGYCGSPFPGGNPVAEGKSVRAYYLDANFTCKTSTRTCTGGVLSGRGNLPSCPDTPTCVLPWGLQLAEGGHIVTTDRDGTPLKPGTCGKPTIKWTCSAGKIVETPSANSCDPGACSAPWGENVSNGKSVDAYRVEIATNCAGNKISRKCTNGVLGGDTSYDRPHCFQDRNPCMLPWGKELGHGQSVDGYNVRTAYNGSTCDKKVFSCTNGVLKGPKDTHKFEKCSVSTRSCASPWVAGEVYEHLAIVEGCTTDTAYGSQMCNCTARQCIDGALTNPAWKFKTCTYTPANCKTPWNTTVKHGDSVKAYRDNTKNSTAACEAASNIQQRTCNNGTLEGDAQHRACTTN